MIATTRLDGPIVRVTLAAGGCGGLSIDEELVDGLNTAIDQIEGGNGRVLVLDSGEDGLFCRGADLERRIANPGEDFSAGVIAFARVVRRLAECPGLVIALVDGEAHGGGVALVAAADVVICTSRARFLLPEIVFGLIPAIVLPLLIDRMGPQRARLLALSGELNCAAALAAGLVDETVPDGAQLEPALRRALRRALRLHPGAVSDLKRFCRQVTNLPTGEAVEVGAQWTARTLADPALMGEIGELFAGRSPSWFASLPDRSHS